MTKSLIAALLSVLLLELSLDAELLEALLVEDLPVVAVLLATATLALLPVLAFLDAAELLPLLLATGPLLLVLVELEPQNALADGMAGDEPGAGALANAIVCVTPARANARIVTTAKPFKAAVFNTLNLLFLLGCSLLLTALGQHIEFDEEYLSRLRSADEARLRIISCGAKVEAGGMRTALLRKP